MIKLKKEVKNKYSKMVKKISFKNFILEILPLTPLKTTKLLYLEVQMVIRSDGKYWPFEPIGANGSRFK